LKNQKTKIGKHTRRNGDHTKRSQCHLLSNVQTIFHKNYARIHPGPTYINHLFPKFVTFYSLFKIYCILDVTRLETLSQNKQLTFCN